MIKNCAATLYLVLGLSVTTLGAAADQLWQERHTWVSEFLNKGGSLDDITGLVKSEKWRNAARWDDLDVEAGLPPSWDWRRYRHLQPIRNQKTCGSCWFFAITAVTESLHRLLYPLLWPYVDLAEQEGVSCSGKGSCNGGYFDAFDFVVREGITDEENFPYLAKNAPCKRGLPKHAKLSAWRYIGDDRRGATIAQLKQAIYDHGPIAVDVNGDFSSYGGGIYNACSSTSTNHMVTIEGWQDDPTLDRYGGGYWIMRNSWGEDWGEKGYMRIVYQSKRGAKCNGIGKVGAYAIMDGIENIRIHLLGG